MKSTEFIAKLKDIAAIRTVYMWGMFGGLVTEARIQEKAKQYRSYYTASRQQQLRLLIGKNVYAFDCVGLIKGIIWGWRADPNPLGHGGAQYQSNNLPDLDANVMINRCSDVSPDFSRILPGCVVWMQGHIGVYIGEGKVIEAMPSWQDGVQVTACWNIGQLAGLQGRRWTQHGKLPWIEYAPGPTPVQPPPLPKTIVPALVDNEVVGTMQGAYILDGKTYVELRSTAEALGLRVHYVSATTPIKLRR